jgi:serine phosphatase RsbU (regulator of sigma subunit)
MATAARRLDKAAAPAPAVAARPKRSALEELRAQHAALAAELAAARNAAAKLEQTLAEAAQLQRRVCGPHTLRRGRFELAAELFPLGPLSGDFSAIFDLGGELGFVVGDVAGKDIAAGLWVTHLVGLARLAAEETAGPAEALARMNRHLCSLPPGTPLVALCFCRLDPRRGVLRYSNAGQPAPFVLRADGKPEPLAAGGPMLGALADASFEAGEARLVRGDVLIGFSDGVVECRNLRDEEFGWRRVVEAARMASAASAGSLLFSILGAVQDFAGARPRLDDFTLLVARCRE